MREGVVGGGMREGVVGGGMREGVGGGMREGVVGGDEGRGGGRGDEGRSGGRGNEGRSGRGNERGERKKEDSNEQTILMGCLAMSRKRGTRDKEARLSPQWLYLMHTQDHYQLWHMTAHGLE